MARDLSRLLRPRTIAVVGGGAWCNAVITQLQKSNYQGQIFPVHPKGGEICNLSVYKGISDLPAAPDASFIGVNRNITVEIVQALSDQGAGGAVCFASGFAEVEDGHIINENLLKVAGDMPILGPNCYGLINAFDGALLWPDQHGCQPVETGVALLTQSSNIAVNLTMQARALPIGYVITCGNQAQTSQAEIAIGLLDDPRVSAIGLHIEGFGNLDAWQALARKAQAKKIPLVALKVGRSSQAQSATISHTASLAGSDAGAQALLDRLGISRVDDLPTLLETLKILHIAGPLTSNKIASISCSGGEASLVADMVIPLDLSFPLLNKTQSKNLSLALGPKVTLANPLDYHTYIWRNEPAMTDAFSAMVDPDLALTMLIVDFPRADQCDVSDWDHVVQAALNTKARTGGNIAMVATLPELMPEDVAAKLMRGGVIPLNGLTEALQATVAAQIRHTPDIGVDLCAAHSCENFTTMTEADAKSELRKHGLQTPHSATIDKANDLTFPLVLKGEGFAHKTENNAVILNLLSAHDVSNAAAKMHANSYLLEEMVTSPVAELIVGVVRDPAHGFVLTIGAGGTLAELIVDVQTLLIPASQLSIKQALSRLKVAKILDGYRGKPAANKQSIIAAICAIQDYVLANADKVEEVEINPLICTANTAIAADALIRIAK